MPALPGWTLWLTGPPAAGKSTIGRALHARLRDLGCHTVLLDSDDLRPLFLPDLAYSDDERAEFYLRLVRLALLVTRSGVSVIIAATGNRREYRDQAHRLLTPFAEVWVRCPLPVCQARDPKGLYAAAAEGSIANLPGVDTPYEPPIAPAITVDSDQQAVAEAVTAILAGVPFLREIVLESARE
jgi:adenylylsulfate kinase